MDRSRALLNKFYTSVAKDNPEAIQAIADCYHPRATFEDIAFKLSIKKRIHAMWHMIAKSDLRLTYEIESADDRSGVVRWVAHYTFTDTNRSVCNELRSSFALKDGLIFQQRDDSDAWRWCMQALGPIKGPLAWLVPAIRQKKAADKLDAFIELHPQYR